MQRTFKGGLGVERSPRRYQMYRDPRINSSWLVRRFEHVKPISPTSETWITVGQCVHLWPMRRMRCTPMYPRHC